MTYIYFIASFQAFFFMVLLFQKRPKKSHDIILTFWLLYLGLATATYALSIDFFPDSPLLSSAVIASFLLHGPFLYLYVSALTVTHVRFRYQHWGHFIPLFAFILYLLVAFMFPAYSKRIRIDHVTNQSETPVVFDLFLIMTALSGPVYFYLAFRKFRESKDSALNFSSKETNLEWMGKLIPIFGMVWTILMAIAIIHHVFHLFSMEFCTNGLFLSLSVFIILIGYFGFKQQEVFMTNSLPTTGEVAAETEPEVKYASSRLEAAELQRCCDKVSSYMTTERPYLESDLTLPKLAEDLGVSTHHLSQIINEVHGKNFFNFINEYRVNEVKRKIQDPAFDNYSLLGIAYESGFNSKSAFNRVFKNITGQTPSQFRDSLSS